MDQGLRQGGPWAFVHAQNLHLRSAAVALAFAGVYILGGKTGLALAQVHPSATALWPGTGIATAGLLVFGRRFWPVVGAASFAVNFTTTSEPISSFAIACGNTAEAVIIASLLVRFGDGPRSFDRPPAVILFVGAVALGSLLAATVGAISLMSVGLAEPRLVPSLWTNWWFGDVTGGLLITPVLVLWSLRGPWVRGWTHAFEAALFFCVILVVGFDPGGLLQAAASGPPTGFLVLPLIVWAAFRFTPREAATATLLLGVGAAWNTVRGVGPYARGEASDSFLVLAMALAALAFVSLTLAALVADRRREAESLRGARDQLEARVGERTESLSVAIERLRGEVLERERAEEDLRRSKQRLVEAQRLARLGNWDWDLAQDRLIGSDTFFEICGFEPTKRPERFDGFLAVVHPEDRVRLSEAIAASRGTGNPFELDHRIVRPDGSEGWMRTHGKVEIGPDGRPSRANGTAQDITERLKLEQERFAAIERAKEVDRLRDINELRTRFMNTAAHELNTPLTPIRVQLHLLRNYLEKEDGTHAKQSLSVLERNIERMTGLVGDVLEAARLQAERMGIHKQRVDVVRLAADAAELFQPAMREAGLRFETKLAESIPLEADPKRITQVLYNLLSNALKFTPPGGTVRLTARETAAGVEVSVEDTGIGLAESQIARLFQPFSQVHEDVVTSRPGTGLGLYISRGIASLHGGGLRATSPGPGLGATFVLSLPPSERTHARVPRVAAAAG